MMKFFSKTLDLIPQIANQQEGMMDIKFVDFDSYGAKYNW